MYRLVIVDDKINIREGLSAYFSNGDLGFCVEAVFRDGEETLEYLEQHHENVDVVLTDVKMAKISGIDVAQKIRDCGWKIKVVLISAYKEFEYAHQALELGVYDYLIKPVKFLQIDEVFTNLKKVLDKEKKEIADVESDLKMLLVNQLILEIFSGVLRSETELRKRLMSFWIDESFLNLPCMDIVLKRDISEAIGSKWKYGVERFDNLILNAIISSRINYFGLNNDETKIQLFALPKMREDFRSKEEFYKYMEPLLSDGIEKISEFADVKIQIDAVAEYESVLHFWRENSKTVKLKNLLDIDQMTETTISLMLETTEIMEADEKKETLSDVYNLFSRKRQKNSVDDKTNSSNIVVKKAVKYIEENYPKSISLIHVAEYVNLNPSYFGRLFKICMGESFTDYLVNIRILKAQELLRNSNITVSEVGKRVGYYNTKYFMRLFKGKIGQTPSEYRNKL